MEIKAYRVRFKGKESLGVPLKSDPLLDVMLVKEEPDAYITDEYVGFAVSTHDRGDAAQASTEGGYYQIAFRIMYEATELEMGGLKPDDLELVLDKDHGNPLIFNLQMNLWYQQTFYKADGRPLTKNDIESNREYEKKYAQELRFVDSITTAGVFSVYLRSKIDSAVIFCKRKVYVLPSLLNAEQYKHMLGRLLAIHERLVISTESAVGIGGRDPQQRIHQFGNPQYDAELWQRLKPDIQAIMHMPAIAQEKSYCRLPYNKLRRFDSRVMRSFIRSGGQWAEGVVYTDDHDTQENRIIKRILQRFSSTVLPSKCETRFEEAEIDRRILKELSDQFTPDALSWYKRAQQQITAPSVEREYQSRFSVSQGKFQGTGYQNGRKKRIYFNYNPYNSMFEIRTNPPEKWNPEKGSMTIHDFTYYPLSDSEHPCGLCLSTEDFSTALEIILILSKLHEAEKSSNLQQNQIDITYYGRYSLTTQSDYYGYGCGPDVTDVDVITIDGVTSCRFLGDNSQRRQVLSLFDLYREILNSNALKYMAKVPEMEIVEFVLSRRAYYTKINTRIDNANMAVSANYDIQNTLSDPWFAAITPVRNLHFEQTPLFIYNTHYRSIYNILHEIVQYHPLLISDFEENLFGVHETHLIYEYWVFYELLNRFLNLGFVFDENTKQVNMQLRHLFVDYLLRNLMPEGFTICLHRNIAKLDDFGAPSGEIDTIEIMVGFNCVFGDQKAPAQRKYDKYLTPDFFVRVTREDGYHWYFFDAKYEMYTEEMLYKRVERGKRKNSIADVCVDKYISKMHERGFIEEFSNFHSKKFPTCWKSEFLHKHYIEGSYLIIAQYQHEPNEQIAAKDRLCGDLSRNIISERPMHRYGSIVFRPGKEDEMTSLLQMIFEYKEGALLVHCGKPVFGKGKARNRLDIFYNDSDLSNTVAMIHVKQKISQRPLTLFACWDSSYEHGPSPNANITISPQLTKGGRYKYYVSCDCGARRYENYCVGRNCRREIIKHSSGNFHYRRTASGSGVDRWNFVCTFCGKDIDPMEEDAEEDISEEGDRM
ncbi:MAG: hypothetical protein IJ719_09910 [Clostridia bacterium]|nr:hypothetical protein [Clostridia bacterium]